MWNMKKSLLFAIALVAVILISMNWQVLTRRSQSHHKSLFQMLLRKTKLVIEFTGEVEKTKAYQTKVWSDKNKVNTKCLKSNQ